MQIEKFAGHDIYNPYNWQNDGTGGAVRMWSQTESEVAVSRCTFDGNVADRVT